MSIEVRNVSKTFGQFKALSGVSLRVDTGELIALLGPSGSGKTTLLRLIGGLETPDPGGGPILFHDEDYSARDVGRRGVGFVFQHYALFRHMTVFENVAFGLRCRPWRLRPRRAEIRERVMDLLKLVQLDGFARRHPAQLSGGQRQRVALARALAVEPKVLLLDEPFGALDATVRRELRRWLRRLHDEIHITSVFVTHDQEEALEVADRVAVMNHGRVEQVGTPEEVYEHPANPFVYKFLGSVNLFHGRLSGDGAGDFVRVGQAEFAPEAGSFAGDAKPANRAVGYVRPHEIELSRHRNGRPVVPLRVKHVSPAGPVVRLYAEPDGGGELVEVELTRDRYNELRPKPGDDFYATLHNVRVFPADYSI